MIQDEKKSDRNNVPAGKSVFQHLKASVERRRLQLENILWPTTLDNLLAVWLMVLSFMNIDHPRLNSISRHFWRFGEKIYLDNSYPHYLRVFLISLISTLLCFIPIVYARRYTLRALLSYKGWLYQSRGSPNKIILLWGLLVSVFRGRYTKLYSYQNSLPRLTVPSLKYTIGKFLESVKPLLTSEDHLEMQKEAKEFLKSVGPKLQWVLQLKSWWYTNYCTDWWEKYAYHSQRDPISINSNCYGINEYDWSPTTNRAARAAGLTSLLLLVKKQIDLEKFDPIVLQKMVPICMGQYGRVFGTTRIPQKEIDKLEFCRDSKHVAVLCNGNCYKLYIEDANGKPVNILDLQSQFEWIEKDAKEYKDYSDAELRVAALTAINRDKWAHIRSEYFSTGSNRKSLQIIEQSLFVVILDDHSFSTLSERGKYSMHGDGTSLWFDKSLNLIVFSDGKTGVNGEHSVGEATIIAHFIELCHRYEYLYQLYDDEGNVQPYFTPDNPNQSYNRSKSLITPKRLCWNISDELSVLINEAYCLSLKNNEDFALCVKRHDAFGKGFIKTTKTSPDAFIQMAIQLAYYKDSCKEFGWTYESATARLFLHGRTETVRSFTEEIKEFVLAMNNSEASDEERKKLVKKANDKHQILCRDSMSGNGIDRHLFALYIAAKGLGYDTPFLKKVLEIPWTLATSQTPVQQAGKMTHPNIPEQKNMYFPGGAFAPVSDKGYGISYIIPDDDVIFFHVSSKKSCSKTDSDRFMDNIYWALNEMKELFDRK